MKKEDYRGQLYARYVSSHLTNIQKTSLEALKKHIEKQRRVHRAYLGRFLPPDKRARILDIGCGYGSFLYFLQKEGYVNTVGIDISPEQVEIADKLGVKGIIQGDFMAFLKEHPDEFDLITALDVIEHFHKSEILSILRAIHQALKPGGIFVMRSPNADGPFAGRHRYGDFTHEVAFTKSSVEQILSVVGFVDIQVRATGPVVYGFRSAVRWFMWQIIRLFLKFYLAVETGSLRGHILTQNLIAAGRKP
ncbi:class I SAM-dependent methyltransferase [Candidatus Bipolaricaulota sp. J31]